MPRTAVFESVKLKGDILTLQNCREMVYSIRRSLSEGHTHLELDFSGVGQMTGSFAGFLAQTIQLVREARGKFVMTGANPEVESLLRVLGFSEFLKPV